MVVIRCEVDWKKIAMLNLLLVDNIFSIHFLVKDHMLDIRVSFVFSFYFFFFFLEEVILLRV